MGNTFPDFVGFRRKWRPSQIQVLEGFAEDIADGKFHLCAAPGSGKTSVGLEIVRRLDQPALVLSPTTASAEQWKNRLKEDFLPEEEEARKWVSRDASVTAPIISITYQSMYSALNVRRPFLKWMKNAGVRTLCLDEPHHLRNEWWRSLEQVAEQLPGLRIVSLTATPPYDATDVEWQRCLALCGEVDREISVPQLVREGVLCPHQDYLYFCCPKGEAAEAVREQRRAGKEGFASFLHEEELTAAVRTHLSLTAPEAYEEFFLNEPEYFLAFLSFLKENRIDMPAAFFGRHEGAASVLPEMGAEAVPPMTERRMETFLRGFLTYDRDSYEGAGDYQKKLEEELKERKLIARGKIDLTRPLEVRQLLNAGREKLAAVERIVRNEWDNLGENLHMLILTDHIKKEQMPVIGDEAKPLKDIGSVPLFEALRRARIEGLYLMVMTGTLMMIPDYLVPWFEEHTRLKWAAVKETGYSRLQFTTDCQEEAVRWMTAMFEEGYANVLIGTASLLGENWECPCLNTLVLATRVGSYMQANQMRGRALRVNPADPDKTVNIWHIVGLDPDAGLSPLPDFLRMLKGRVRAEAGPASAFVSLEGVSEDCEQVIRRSFTFSGISAGTRTLPSGAGAEEASGVPIFENGPERLINCGLLTDSPCEEEINDAVLAKSRDRAAVRSRWQEALAALPGGMRLREEAVLTKREFPEPARRRNVVAGLAAACVCEAVLLAEGIGPRWLSALLGRTFGAVLFAVGFFLSAWMIRRFYGILKKELTPKGRLCRIAHGVMEALQDGEWILTPGVNFAVEPSGEGEWRIYLTGGSRKEEILFADAVCEFLGPVEDPRYILVEALAGGTEAYYPVPGLFGRDKADATLFYRNMKEYMGGVILAGTGGSLGRKLLLRARFYSHGKSRKDFVRRRQTIGP
ncbi:MAG: DEAD/DEAH box helicase family protein [Lachnospiraceae bacterium]|nr:DEAD/DEAH box helicase family protein [Lachnospiraceae bacterium]